MVLNIARLQANKQMQIAANSAYQFAALRVASCVLLVSVASVVSVVSGVRAEGTGYPPVRMSCAFGSSFISLRGTFAQQGTPSA